MGDARFLDKAKERLNAILGRIRTLVLVSHSEVILSTICSEALWLEMGERRAFGSASDVLHCYLIAANHAAT